MVTLKPLYVEEKRDPAKRYLVVETGELISYRQKIKITEGKTPEQKHVERVKQGKSKPGKTYRKYEQKIERKEKAKAKPKPKPKPAKPKREKAKPEAEPKPAKPKREKPKPKPKPEPEAVERGAVKPGKAKPAKPAKKESKVEEEKRIRRELKEKAKERKQKEKEERKRKQEEKKREREEKKKQKEREKIEREERRKPIIIKPERKDDLELHVIRYPKDYGYLQLVVTLKFFNKKFKKYEIASGFSYARQKNKKPHSINSPAYQQMFSEAQNNAVAGLVGYEWQMIDIIDQHYITW